MLIDITKFMIITPVQFELLIENYQANLSTEDPAYLATYFFTNFFAYFLILIFIWLVVYICNKSFKGWFK